MNIEPVNEHYPGATDEEHFITHTASLLLPLGFTQENCLPIVAICRDEICTSFVEAVEAEWGPCFNLGGLAGIPFAGKTGMAAASHHAPDSEERDRFVIYGMAHIGFGPEGEIGACVRPGMQHVNGACGALIGYGKQLGNGGAEARKIEADDIEFSLLKLRLNAAMPEGKSDLITITNTALHVIKRDIDALCNSVLDKEHHDYAVFIGTVLHLPDRNLVHLAESRVVAEGVEYPLSALPELDAA